MKKKKTAQQFARAQIASIALAYSQGDYTHADFTQQYDCSKHVFYTLLHLAVEKLIVSDKVSEKIMRVAVSNSFNKAMDTYGDPERAEQIAAKIESRWKKRITSRKNFSFSKKEAIRIAHQYAESRFPKEIFCKYNYISKPLFDKTLVTAITSGWVTDECFQKLYLKARKFNPHDKVDHFFGLLSEKRKENVSK